MATYAVGSGKAYTTIQSAINAAGAANDINALIPVDAGTYTENLNIRTRAGGWSMPVSVYAADSSNRPTIVSSAGSYAIQADAACNADAGTRQPTFTNIIWSGGSAATCFFYSAGGVPAKFIGCDFLNINLPMFYFASGGSSTSYRWLLDKCYFYNTGQIVFANAASYGLMRNCRIYWTKNSTNMIQSNYANWLAYNNSIATTANGGTLFIIGEAKNNAIKVVSSTPTKFFSVVTSYAYNVTSTSLTNTGTDGGGNVVGEPGFTDYTTGDFRFATSSACYNAGTTLSDVTEDYLGTARPQVTTYDVGAYEYINVVFPAWNTGSGETYSKASSNFVINKYLNLSNTYSLRSGLNSANGLTTVQQVPFSHGIPGPVSLRLRTKAYIVVPEGHNPSTQAGTPATSSV